MNQYLSGTEGLRRIAMEYLDAITDLKDLPDARLVANAVRAGRNFELGTKVVREEDEMFRELFMRITPFETKGRALRTEA